MANCKVLSDFLHILKVEQRIEASFILKRKRKHGIFVLGGNLFNSKSASIIKAFISLMLSLT